MGTSKNKFMNLEVGKSSVVNQMGFDRHINIYDESSSHSVASLLPKDATFLKERMHEVPEELRNMDHYELRKRIKPSPTLNQLRLNFWAEYDRCIELSDRWRVMTTNNVIAGVCSVPVFKHHMMDVEKLAWILTPVQSYTMGVQDVLETCLYKMRCGLEKLDMTSVKDLNSVIKIYEAFDKRVHGDYQQKVTKEIKYTGTSNGVLNKEDVAKKLEDYGIKNNTVIEYNDVSKRENISSEK